MTAAQPQWLRAMHDPGFYPHPVRSVSVCETHISLVFLTGEFVYKIKKPVDLGFLDFTTLSKRQHYCRREVALNRRLTAGVYSGVVPITEGEDGLHLDGPGTPVEYAVQMRQLSERYAMKRLLADDKIDASAIELLARTLHRFYAEAASGPEIDGYGSRETVEKNCEENFRQIESAGEAAVDRRRQIGRASCRERV